MVLSSLHLVMHNHDEIFERMKHTAVIANDLDVITLEGKKQLNELVYTHYEGDTLNPVPRCSCHKYTGGQFRGVVCEICKDICLPDLERPLEPLLWIKAPEGVKALINPYAWIILSEVATKSKFNVIEWLCSPQYKPGGAVPKRLDRLELWLKERRIGRGLNSFHDHFDELMEFCLKLQLIKESGPRKSDTRDWIAKHRKLIFSQHIPMPSKVCFIKESSNDSTFLDKTITLASNALLTIASINNSPRRMDNATKQRRVLSAIKDLAEYHHSFISDVVGSKPGLGRQHVFGGRLNFTSRTVITSIAGRHRYDDLHLPWGAAVQLFKVHLHNKLANDYDMSPNEAEDLIRESSGQYNQQIHQILINLLKESPEGRIPCLFGRNPSLARGSIQLLWIALFKTDVTDNTISISNTIIKAPNADFDGDEMNLTLILDHARLRRVSRMAPELGAFDLDKPRELASTMEMPSPLLETAWNWMYHRRKHKPVKAASG